MLNIGRLWTCHRKPKSGQIKTLISPPRGKLADTAVIYYFSTDPHLHFGHHTIPTPRECYKPQSPDLRMHWDERSLYPALSPAVSRVGGGGEIGLFSSRQENQVSPVFRFPSIRASRICEVLRARFQQWEQFSAVRITLVVWFSQCGFYKNLFGS